MQPPKKPFSEYKWRWATVTCTEGLNSPPVYLGVLRAMNKCEGLAPSDKLFFDTLKIVEANTQSTVNLARGTERNIIRNSGQYWKALDLLEDTRGQIRLTKFGKKVAEGRITSTEFATTVIKELELPNVKIGQDSHEWQQAGLKIKPLELILNILAQLQISHGILQGYITTFELTRIIIPLAGESSSIQKHVDSIMMYRSGKLDISLWPNCTPNANDSRIAREFLLFLWHYGFCNRVESVDRNTEKYFLDSLDAQYIINLVDLDTKGDDTAKILDKVRESQLTSVAERKKILTQVISRPQQSRFRKDVLSAYKSTCFLTKVDLPSVLEAAHIIPVSDNGIDTIDNGICLRSDIHLLYDTGHLRIDPTGIIHLSETAAKTNNYSFLPTQVIIPSFVSIDKLTWRWSYK